LRNNLFVAFTPFEVSRNRRRLLLSESNDLGSAS